MTRSSESESGPVAFEWDDGNVDKNWEKHGVRASECEEVFFNRPLLVLENSSQSDDELRQLALGQTHAGRRLFLVFTVRETRVRVISARDMTRKERRIYDQTS